MQYAPAVRIVPLADDTRLLETTQQVLARGVDIVVATTGIGFRGWMEAAEIWGLAEQLLATLSRAELIARGPKVKGAIRAAGLTEKWAPDSESTHRSTRTPARAPPARQEDRSPATRRATRLVPRRASSRRRRSDRRAGLPLRTPRRHSTTEKTHPLDRQTAASTASPSPPPPPPPTSYESCRPATRARSAAL